MKSNYLFPNKYKKIGWFILIPTAIIGLIMFAFDYEIEPRFLDFRLPAIFIEELSGNKLFGMVKNNIFNELLGISLILSSLIVAFTKEKEEDEYIANIRLESLVWAVYVNYGVLLLAFIFVFDISFIRVMLYNMFTLLFFFIIKFNWQISKLQKPGNHEE